MKNKGIIIMLFFCFVITGINYAQNKNKNHPNVLFIVVDDMNDWIHCLNNYPDAVTPNIDRLANMGMLFTNTMCASPLCGPSRAAVFTGKRPETTHVYHNIGDYTDYAPNEISIPEYFKNAGYYSMGAGKLIHPTGNVVPKAFHEYGPGTGVVGTPFTDEELLTVNMDPTVVIKRGKLQVTLPMNGISTLDRPSNRWSTFDWGPLDITDSVMPDGKIALWAINKLNNSYKTPFFLAAGFYKPHQPFFAPRKYFDMYNQQSVSLPPTIAGDLNDLPWIGQQFGLLPWTAGTHKTVTEYGQWKEGIRGYLAVISFADAQVGKLLDALENSPYSDNTLIIFWSDHGWHLGEKEHWGKFTPWERSVHTSMIIVPPKKYQPKGFIPGTRCDALVSLLDIYPTLLEMCHLEPKTDLEGQSLLPLLMNPDTAWNFPQVTTIGIGNHSVRTKNWRYIKYFDGTEELYDHRSDPEEWFNLAGNPKFKIIKQRLSGYIPEDKRVKQFVRWSKWKAVIMNDGSFLLFDILEPSGISDQHNVADDNADVVRYIRTYLKEKNIHAKYVKITDFNNID